MDNLQHFEISIQLSSTLKSHMRLIWLFSGKKMNTCSSKLPIREKSEKTAPNQNHYILLKKVKVISLDLLNNNGSLRLKKNQVTIPLVQNLPRARCGWDKTLEGRTKFLERASEIVFFFSADVIIGNLWEVSNNNCFVQFCKLHCSKMRKQ